MNYDLLLKQEAIGATKRLGIILGVVWLLTVSISAFHVLRELQGLPYDGGPLYDNYLDFYHSAVTFTVWTFCIMSACFSLHNYLLGDQQKMTLWLVLATATPLMGL